MKQRSLWIATFALGAAGAHAQQQFLITVTNLGGDTPLAGQTAIDGQPLSPVFVSVGDSTFDIFDVGGFASNGIKKIAEGGDYHPLLNYADSQIGGSVLDATVLGGSPFLRGQSVSGVVTADANHSILSFAAMLGHTNDSFIGESASSADINLLANGTPLNETITIYGNRAWDAGTEQNTQNAADLGFLGGSGNPDDSNPLIRVSSGVQAGVGDSWQLMENWSQSDALATIQIQALPAPEPASIAALGLGIGAILRRRRAARR